MTVVNKHRGEQFGTPLGGAGNPVGYFQKLFLGDGTIDVPIDVDSVIAHAKVTLTSAQILALDTTPITLVAAPGAGYAIDVLDCVGILNFLASGGVAYTGTNDLALYQTNGSGAVLSAAFPHATFMNGSASNLYKVDAVANNVVVANAAVVAFVPTANPAAGNGTITLDVAYRVVKLP